MKKLVMVAAALFVIGVVGVLSTMGSDVDFFNESLFGTQLKIDEKEQFQVNKIDNIKVKVGSTDVKLIPTNDDIIDVHLYGKGNKKGVKALVFETEQQGNTLYIKVHSKGSIGINYHTVDLNITVPQKLFDNITVNASSADIHVEQLKANTITMHTNSGDQQLQIMEADKMDIKSSSGDLKLSDLHSDKLKIRASSGDIEAEKLIGEIDAKASSGTIKINFEQFQKNATIEASSGDVIVEIDKEPSSFSLDFKGSSGSGKSNMKMNYDVKAEHEIRGEKGSGDNSLVVRTSSGDFDLNVR